MNHHGSMREFQKSTAAIKASLQKVRFATFTLQKEENPKAGVDVRDEENLSSAPEELRQEHEVARCVCSAANMVAINREELLWNCCGWGGVGGVGGGIISHQCVFVNMLDHMFVCGSGFTQRKVPKAKDAEQPRFH